MTFLAPTMLWSLAALVPLAAIYFLKVRPRRKPTTAYFLWERIFQERRASSLFHRLRDAWSLVMMALAAAAICFALARPEWTDKRADLLIVIDNSASMAAREGRTTRLELAKELASEIVRGLNGSQRAAVATTAQQLDYQSHLTDNPRELLEAIENVQSNAESLDLENLPAATWQQAASEIPRPIDKPAAKSGSAVASPAQQKSPSAGAYRVLLLTDGGFDTARVPGHVELIKVGTTLENIGLVAADMQFLAGNTSRIGFYYQVASTFTTPQKVDLTLFVRDETGQDSVQKVIPLTISPGVNRPETFELTNAPAGRWLARLEMDDALEMDNTVYLSLPKPEPIRVAVESTDRYFLENSVHAFSQGDNVLALTDKDPMVVLAKSQTPQSDLAIIFQPAGESIWWTELGEELSPGAARVLIEDHPLLRYLDATSIPFVGARKVVPVAGAQVLVADDSGLPLIYKARHGRQSAVVVNMDPVAADFYFSAWFPVLVHSAVTHLVGHETVLPAAHRSGDPIIIPGGRDDITTKIALPSTSASASRASKRFEMHRKQSQPDTDASTNVSSSTAIENSASSTSLTSVTGNEFRGANEVEFYTSENTSGTHTVGTSLLSTAETLLNNEASQSNNEALSRGYSPATWLTALAIVALTAESVLYHRRKVG